MRFPAADLNFFQNNSLDVILFLIAIIYVVLKTSYLLLKFAAKAICRSGRKTEEKKTVTKTEKKSKKNN